MNFTMLLMFGFSNCHVINHVCVHIVNVFHPAAHFWLDFRICFKKSIQSCNLQTHLKSKKGDIGHIRVWTYPPPLNSDIKNSDICSTFLDLPTR